MYGVEKYLDKLKFFVGNVKVFLLGRRRNCSCEEASFSWGSLGVCFATLNLDPLRMLLVASGASEGL